MEQQEQLSIPLEQSADLALAEVHGGRAGVIKTSIVRINLARLAMRGLNAKEAAKQLGIGLPMALKHYRDPEFQKDVYGRVTNAFGASDGKFAEQKLTLTEMINKQAYESFHSLVKLLDDPECTVTNKVKIHQDFLDRNEESAKHGALSHNIDPEQLAVAAKVALEMTLSRKEPTKIAEVIEIAS